MRYRQHWHCERPGEGHHDPDTEEWVPGEPELVHDGPADVQDSGTQTNRDQEGRLVVRSVSTMFLKDEAAVPRHRVGDVGVVTWEDGTTDDAEVTLVRRLDGTMELGWVSDT